MSDLESLEQEWKVACEEFERCGRDLVDLPWWKRINPWAQKKLAMRYAQAATRERDVWIRFCRAAGLK